MSTQAPNTGNGSAGLDRFRSFAERYVIARAPEFDKGKELEDGWQALQNAKKIYEMIARVPNPDAQRGEGAQTPPPISRPPMIYGVPLPQVVQEMREAGLPNSVIRQYVNDFLAGGAVPPHTSFLKVAPAVQTRTLKQAKKGQHHGTP